MPSPSDLTGETNTKPKDGNQVDNNNDDGNGDIGELSRGITGFFHPLQHTAAGVSSASPTTVTRCFRLFWTAFACGGCFSHARYACVWGPANSCPFLSHGDHSSTPKRNVFQSSSSLADGHARVWRKCTARRVYPACHR